MELYEDMKSRISQLTRSQYAIAVLDALFDRPIFQSADFIQRTNIPKQSALPILRKLREDGILVPLREQSGRRPAVLAFAALLNRAEGRQVI
jgi:transcription initiation factor IIE alpha subunit